MIEALAHFHEQSVGYEPPPGVPVFSKLGKWPKHYMKRCRQLEAWKQLAKLDRDDPFSRLYLAEIDRFIEKGEEVLQQLLESYYETWVEQMKKRPSLCHQDYGTGNSLRGEDGNVWIIDLDTTAFDLPIRDVRKMMAPFLFETDEKGKTKADIVLEAYEDVRPLTKKEKRCCLSIYCFRMICMSWRWKNISGTCLSPKRNWRKQWLMNRQNGRKSRDGSIRCKKRAFPERQMPLGTQLTTVSRRTMHSNQHLCPPTS